jgi:predicted nucleic acid-binding protein
MPAPSPVVVSDASVLIFLAAAGQFRLLRDLYGRVLIPPKVFQEVAEARPGRSGDSETRSAVTDGWVEIKAPAPTSLDGWLQSQLNAGESQAIALALELKAASVLIDESDGRRIAARLGLTPTGTLGVLLAGKAAGLIPAVKPVLDDLIQNHSFHINEVMARSALAGAGEA